MHGDNILLAVLLAAVCSDEQPDLYNILYMYNIYMFELFHSQRATQRCHTTSPAHATQRII